MDSARAKLRDYIQKTIVSNASGARIVSPGGADDAPWLFDVRSLLLTPDFLTLAAESFWERYADIYPFQVGGIETVGIALVAAIVMKGAERGTPVNGFYIRKSRKHTWLQKHIEGTLNDLPIVLVDDILNSGTSFLAQIETLKVEGKVVRDVFAFVRFRPDLQTLGEGVCVTALFSPEDFGLRFSVPKFALPDHEAFVVSWAVRCPNPNYFHRVPKSAPMLDDTRVYFGSDDGVMHALLQATGREVWSFSIRGKGANGKTIFSSPALHDGALYFGAYDGNFYALDAETGKVRWAYEDADWIGSSPVVAPDVGLVFVGLEFGLWKKRGGIVALDAKTGAKRWEYVSMPEFTHGSPAYSKKFDAVAIGSNDGVLYLFRVSDGTPIGQYQTGGAIKYAPVFDEAHGYVIVGSFDGKVYVIDVRDGSLVFDYQTDAGIYSTPVVSGDRVYVASLDKKVYCLNLATHAREWAFQTAGRVFASPLLADGFVYVGSNDGRLYELDPATGRNIAFFQTTERITNRVAYNAQTKQFFLLTYANELYCLERKPRAR